MSRGARAGIGAGVCVLDVGCGVGGPGQLLAGETGCGYLGADFSASAVAIARERAPELRFAVTYVPPLPDGPFDVVLLLEAMLAPGAAQAAPAGCQLAKFLDIPVTMEGRRPIVTAQIGGREARFILDSGAFFSTIARANAATVGGMDIGKTQVIGVIGAGRASRGLIRLRSGKIVTVRLGDRIDGGAINSIGNGRISYVKGGRQFNLPILNGR